jgi:2-desacetyl-2-hydroxyethyl bacteriochlorophyllide A dehydrogenase
MKAVIITELNRLSIEEVPMPVAGPKEVLLQVSCVGICGTDLHILDGHYASSLPITPGHEFAGVVVEVGQSVSGISVGDHVSADPNIYCGECIRCRIGRTNLCENASAVGVDLPGALAEFVVVPAANCVVLAPDVDLRAASLVEPLSCAVHAFDVMNARVGQHFLIYGAGPMGLILAWFARRALAASISVVDLNEQRLSWAKEAGAAEVATSADRFSVAEFGVVIDCTGAVPAIEDGISRLAPGGTFLQFGVPQTDARVSISPERLLMSELTLTGSRAVHQSFERAADIFSTGALDPELIISDRFSLDDSALAFSRFRSGQGRKIQILPGGLS